jgi:glycosyltransferase involved in cell wall biosynthesis
MYEACNVLVFPSLVKEAFGITQVEAMAAGLVVVGSGTGGAVEIIEHGKSGLLFQSGNPLSLATELIKLTEEKRLWETMRIKGQQRALELFDIEKSVDRIEEIFGEMKEIE